MGNRGGVDIGVGTSRIGRPRGEEEARLLKFRRDRRELRDRGADHIADRVVAQNPISTAATEEGVITPTVEYLSTHATCTMAYEDDAGEPLGKGEKGRGNRRTTG